MPPSVKRALRIAPALVSIAAGLVVPAFAFRCPSPPSPPRGSPPPLRLHASRQSHSGDEALVAGRRAAVGRLLTVGLVGIATGSIHADSASALVEGNKPPSKTKSLGEEYRQGTAALADPADAETIPREAYKKLPSGVVYADISVGTGEEVREGSRVNLQWVLRRSDGYFVDSSAVSDSVPFIFAVGDPKGAIAGLDEGVRGMRSGGTRRILIPPRLAYVGGLNDGSPGPVPAGFGPRQQMRRVMEVRRDVPGEYVFLEVKVTKVR